MIEQLSDLPPGDTPHQRRSRRARLRAFLADPPRRRRALLVLAALTLLIVAVLAVLVSLFNVLSVDLWATRQLQERRLALLWTMYGVSLFGYQPWAAVTVVAGTLGIGLWLGWRVGGYLLALTVAQGLVNAGLKLAVGRPRPVGSLVEVLVPEHGNSFPSGHVMFYTVFFGMLAFLIWTHMHWPRLRWSAVVPCLCLVLLVGSSRMLLGSHWLSDVLAAYLLGVAILAVGIEGYVTWLAPQTFAEQDT
ncbi:MAG TPA: phosphatase PAP2 family protein, partial [Roseiflexaceae bacterium]|nr:phosphatase PAP2 family protein [Roseiflexaceae bacterium]